MMVSKYLAQPVSRTPRNFDPKKEPYRVHAYGAGVQSQFLVIWYTEFSDIEADGPSPYAMEYPNLVCFADTQAESADVYANVETARQICETAGIRFEIVTAGDLANPPPASTGTQGIFVPAFTLKLQDDSDGKAGDRGQLMRQCTGRFKIDPCIALAKKLAGDRPIEIWLGISLEEASRMKKTDPDDRIQYAYPLIFDKPLSPMRLPQEPKNRSQCIELLRALEEPIVKSACWMCPYRSDYAWAQMKRDDPTSFELACAYDKRIRHLRPGYELYIHKSRIPLREAYFQAADPNVMNLGLFADADMSLSGGCEEGYCGL